MRMFDIPAKWNSFGWAVKIIDGHDMTQIVGAIDWLDKITDRPAVVIAQTVKGKGVSYMENNPAFHGAAPSDEQLAIALKELGVEA